MSLHPLAGQPAPAEFLIDSAQLERDYYQPSLTLQPVSFGTSGHRGTPADGTFNEPHILAITQAICDYRREQGIDGPLYLGQDTHAMSEAAHRTAIEVLAANGVHTIIAANNGFTPPPVISRAILAYNSRREPGLADGIVITPSHNPPADGGFKYNTPNGGPAETSVTAWIEDRANALLGNGSGIHRTTVRETIHAEDLITPYVRDLSSAVDLDAVRASGVRIGVDPLGGASAAFWEPIAEIHRLHLTIVNPAIDPTFRFMTLDHDGKIRMDCSSPHAMASLVKLKDQFDIAFGNDPDADRHGIVTPGSGLMNPNHYLAVAIDYLFTHRGDWSAESAVGKTLVSSSLIDRVVASHGRRLYEVPVGFKWFTAGLFDGTVCFGGEESAGASFLRRDGSVWSTDKDGIILGLLAAEITARTNKDPGECYRGLAARFGESAYRRMDAPATPEQKQRLKKLSPDDVTANELAGEPITAKFTSAAGNGASIGGLKVTTNNGWFAARPSGTENIYKLYAESLLGPDHLAQILQQAQDIVTKSLQVS